MCVELAELQDRIADLQQSIDAGRQLSHFGQYCYDTDKKKIDNIESWLALNRETYHTIGVGDYETLVDVTITRVSDNEPILINNL